MIHTHKKSQHLSVLRQSGSDPNDQSLHVRMPQLYGPNLENNIGMSKRQHQDLCQICEIEGQQIRGLFV